MHRQDERGRRIGLADNAENMRRVRSARASAAKRGRDGQGQQSGLRQILEISERKTTVAVVNRRPLRECLGQQRRTRDMVGLILPLRFPCRDMVRCRHHVASNPSRPRICLRRSAR